MGRPQDFDDNETGLDKAENLPHKESLEKKLFRHRDQAILGGVFSGLSHYFKIDPVKIRVLYVTLF